MSHLRSLIIVLLCTCLLAGCGGIEPVPVAKKTVLQGSVVVRGIRPSSDSLISVRVVAMDTIPTSTDAILRSVLGGSAVYSDNLLPVDRDTIAYMMILPDQARTFTYVCVGQQFTSNIFTDWKVVGLYVESTNDSTPKPIVITPFTTHTADILVDFSSLPPQPFK